jgi:hypothetical protein
MVFNATFNDISVISWRQVLFVEETGVCGENHRPVASHWQTLLHNVVLKVFESKKTKWTQHDYQHCLQSPFFSYLSHVFRKLSWSYGNQKNNNLSLIEHKKKIPWHDMTLQTQVLAWDMHKYDCIDSHLLKSIKYYSTSTSWSSLFFFNLRIG